MPLYDETDLVRYRTLGYVVFRRAVPPSLVRDLRREAAKAPALARAADGPDAQRLQPIAAFDDFDPRPFRDFAELPDLREAVATFCGPDFEFGNVETMAIFVEPARSSWCTNWHRDLPDSFPGDDLPALLANPSLYHQLNCALYEDSSTWYVPGSHLRPHLTAAERAAFPDATPVAMTPYPQLDGADEEERERACLDYCGRMPGALRVTLDAGDFLLYRNTAWHLGSYVPYKRRATLHDFVWNEEYRAYYHSLWATVE